MNVRIEELKPVQLVGMRIQTSLEFNETSTLWQRFGPRRKEILHKINEDAYSVSIFPKDMQVFSPQISFEKWAAVAVSDFKNVPEGMETLLLEGGLYAVFIHKGPVSGFGKTMGYINGHWLPRSDYNLRKAPRFEILGDKYLGVAHPDSEEEIWIPIQEKLI